MKQITRLLAGIGLFSASLAICGTATPEPAQAQDATIAAVVNGQLITNGDVDARARLLAVSTGMPLAPEFLQRLKPQITRELIDQTLQLQEINKRKIVVPEADIATSVAHIEQGNSMQPGGLRARLEGAGIDFQTLISQLRIEVGWQQVLHQVLGPGPAAHAGRYRGRKAHD